VRIHGSLARHGWLAAIAVVYLYAFPYFPQIHSANELPRVYLVKAIVEDHTFAIDRGSARWGATADTSAWGGHLYSNKAPGSSLLAVPAYAAVRAVTGEPSLAATLWLCRLFTGVLPMLGFLWLLWGFLDRTAPDPAVRRVVLLGYALGSLAMTYSILFYSHQLGAICIATAWILASDVIDGRRGLAAMAVAGLAAGAAPLCDYQAVFAALPIAVAVVVKLPRAQLPRAIGLAVAGAAAPIAVLLAYHVACFGSPWRTGYAATPAFATLHEHGLLGLTYPRAAALWGSLFRPDNGLFVVSPWWLLAVPGGVRLWRRGDRTTALIAAAATAIYVWFVSSIAFWRGGWGVGPRYITAMLPFLLPPIAALLSDLRDRPVRFGAAAGLIGVGVVVYVLSSATFPYWPDSVTHPLYDVTFRLIGDGLAAPSLGSALGAPGLAGVAPCLALAFGAFGAAVARAAGWRGLVTAVVVTGAVVLGYRLIPHGEPRADAAYRSVRKAVLDL
jgi:hypothetical protein